jgi:hypothetical protein
VKNAFPVGSLVRIANYSPFRGRKGIIRNVDSIFDDGEQPFCFYLVTMEGTQLKEPMWFEYDEIELITSPLVASQADA